MAETLTMPTMPLQQAPRAPTIITPPSTSQARTTTSESAPASTTTSRPIPLRPCSSYQYQSGASLSSKQIIDAASYSTTPCTSPPRSQSSSPVANRKAAPTSTNTSNTTTSYPSNATISGEERERRHSNSTFSADDWHRPVPTHEALRQADERLQQLGLQRSQRLKGRENAAALDREEEALALGRADDEEVSRIVPEDFRDEAQRRQAQDLARGLEEE